MSATSDSSDASGYTTGNSTDATDTDTDTNSSVSGASDNGGPSPKRRRARSVRREEMTDTDQTTEGKPSLGRRVRERLGRRPKTDETDASYQTAPEDVEPFVSDDLRDTGYWDDYPPEQNPYTVQDPYSGYSGGTEAAAGSGISYKKGFYDDPNGTKGSEKLAWQTMGVSEAVCRDNKQFKIQVDGVELTFTAQPTIYTGIAPPAPMEQSRVPERSQRRSRSPRRSSRRDTQERQTDNSRYDSEAENDTYREPPPKRRRQPPPGREETTDRRPAVAETTESRAPAPATTQSQAPAATTATERPSRPPTTQTQAPVPTPTATQTSTPPTARTQAPAPATTNTQTSTAPTTQRRVSPKDTRTDTVQESVPKPRRKLEKARPQTNTTVPPTDFSDIEAADTAPPSKDTKSKTSRFRRPWTRKPKLDESMRAYDGTAKSDWLDGGYDPSDTQYRSKSEYRDKMLLAHQAAQHAVHSRYDDPNNDTEALMSLAEEALDKSAFNAEGTDEAINAYYDAGPDINIASRIRHALASECPGINVFTTGDPTTLSKLVEDQKSATARSAFLRDLNLESLGLMSHPDAQYMTHEDRINTGLSNMNARSQRR